jgi:tRNA-2-methylthio-N6-dimethylallyladenosine synthase
MTLEGMTFHLETVGCQMNVHDSMIIEGVLRRRGLRNADSLGDAQVVIVNTCSIRDRAEERVFGRLGELAALKDRGNLLVLGVSGCMAQRTAEGVLERAPAVDFVTGTETFPAIPEVLERVIEGRGPIVDVSTGHPLPAPAARALEAGSVKAFVSVMRGCDKRCTFCVVPSTRGSERGRPLAEIVAEVEALAEAGVLEVTLLGQTVNSYRDGAAGFAELLRAVDRVSGIGRIRFTTNHPIDMSEEVLEAVACCPKVCEHLHLPAQSGSTRVLTAMDRRYTRQDYLRVVERVRAWMSKASVTTDLIVGFPGETEEDFAETLSLVETVRFDGAYTFKYSPREGTPAAGMPGQVSLGVMKERLARLNERVRVLADGVNRDLVGREEEVMIEAVDGGGEWPVRARTRTNKTLLLGSALGPVGSIHRVRVSRSRGLTLYGLPDPMPAA